MGRVPPTVPWPSASTFLVRQVRRLENHGRALRMQFEHETLPGGWAGPRK
jgi:hypothetical protein